MSDDRQPQRGSLELPSHQDRNTISIELNRTHTTTPPTSTPSTHASQRHRRQQQHRQESWFRHSMPPAINRDFESLEHLTQDSSNGLDEQLAASLSGGGSSKWQQQPVLSQTSIHLNSANSNLGFIDSDTPNTPITPQSESLAGTLSSNCQQQQQQRQPHHHRRDSSRRKSARNRKDSKSSILSNAAARGLRLTTSFLRSKRAEYEGEWLDLDGEASSEKSQSFQFCI